MKRLVALSGALLVVALLAVAPAAAAKTEIQLYNKTGETLLVKTDAGSGPFRSVAGENLTNDNMLIFALNLHFTLPDGSVAAIVDTGDKDANGDWIIRAVVMEKANTALGYRVTSNEQVGVDIPFGHYGCVAAFVVNENAGKSKTVKWAVQMHDNSATSRLNQCEDVARN